MKGEEKEDMGIEWIDRVRVILRDLFAEL